MAGDRVIVIDVGCARHGADYSIERLVEALHPRLLYGFDPAYQGDLQYQLDGTHVVVSTSVAWTRSGNVGFRVDGLYGKVEKHGAPTKAVDLASFISTLPEEEIVLKIDAEGGEYPLLEHLIARGADKRLKLAWVEWHPRTERVNSLPDPRRVKIEKRISCEVAQWNW